MADSRPNCLKYTRHLVLHTGWCVVQLVVGIGNTLLSEVKYSSVSTNCSFSRQVLLSTQWWCRGDCLKYRPSSKSLWRGGGGVGHPRGRARCHLFHSNNSNAVFFNYPSLLCTVENPGNQVNFYSNRRYELKTFPFLILSIKRFCHNNKQRKGKYHKGNWCLVVNGLLARRPDS